MYNVYSGSWFHEKSFQQDYIKGKIENCLSDFNAQAMIEEAKKRDMNQNGNPAKKNERSLVRVLRSEYQDFWQCLIDEGLKFCSEELQAEHWFSIEKFLYKVEHVKACKKASEKPADLFSLFSDGKSSVVEVRRSPSNENEYQFRKKKSGERIKKLFVINIIIKDKKLNIINIFNFISSPKIIL